MSRKITCDEHGAIPWHGEVICAESVGGCGRVWQLQANRHVPPIGCGKHCVCGRPLTGPGSTARAICADCYRAKRAEERRAMS